MKTKSTIAIIGSSGNMGSAIAKSLSGGKNRLLLFGNDVGKTSRLERDILTVNPGADVEEAGCPVNASWEADIVILAVPYEAEAEVAEKIRPYVTQKIVVSIANPVSATFDGLLTAPETSAAQELQKLLPDAHVVKAFNTTFAAGFSEPVMAGERADAFIAGDDKSSVDTVAELVRETGFNPVVAGDLSVSRTLELMQLLLIQLATRDGYDWHAGWKILHN